MAPTTPKHFQRPSLIFIPWCAGGSRHGRLVRKHVPDSDPGWIPAPAGDTNHVRANTGSRGSKERCSAGACPQPRPRDQPAGTGALLGNLAILVLFIPMIESMPRTPIRGRNSESEGKPQSNRQTPGTPLTRRAGGANNVVPGRGTILLLWQAHGL